MWNFHRTLTDIIHDIPGNTLITRVIEHRVLDSAIRSVYISLIAYRVAKVKVICTFCADNSVNIGLIAQTFRDFLVFGD